MTDDFYSYIAASRADKLNADYSRELANLQETRSNGDYISANMAVDSLAEIRQKQETLGRMYQEHQASMQPAPQYQAPPMNAEEKLAKDWSKCDWGDAYEWASKSKYGVDKQAFQAGMNEVMKRRQSGGQ